MAAGLPLPAATNNAWATMGDDWSNALNDGFILDETINTTTGAMTTNATFATATTFTTTTDTTATYKPGRRLRIVHGGGTTYCRVASAVFGATTTVTIANATSGPTFMTTPITSAAFAPTFGGAAGNDPSMGDLVMLEKWGRPKVGGVKPSTSAVGDSAAEGKSPLIPRADHKHGREAFATNAIVLGTAAVAGVATTLIRTDDTIAAFDATVPVTQALGDAAATGSVAFAARRDHKHGIFTITVDKGSWTDSATSITLSGGTVTKTITVTSGRNLCRAGIEGIAQQGIGLAFGGTATTDAYGGGRTAGVDGFGIRAYETDTIHIGSTNGYGSGTAGAVSLQDFYINGTSLTWVFRNDGGVTGTLSARSEGHAW
jgi:hypothetical protein